MTVPAATRRAGPFIGNGVATSFPFTFKVFATTDIQIVRTNADGSLSTLVLSSDYSVTLNGDQTASPGGSVTYPLSGSPLSASEKLAIIGALPYDQTLDLPGGGAFSPTALENQLDRQVMQIQQLADGVASAVRAPLGETLDELPDAATRANTLMGFNGSGQPTVNVPTSGSAADVLVKLANSGNVNEGDALVALKRSATGAAGVTLHAWHEQQVYHPVEFGAVGDGTTNDVTALQAAIDAAEAQGGGTVLLAPNKNYRITSPLAMKAGVDLVGCGFSSLITADGVDAITFGFTAGFGNLRLSNFRLQGTSTTTKIGIYQAGTLNDADELYGVSIDNVLCKGFNISVKFRTVRQLNIYGCWFEDCNSGIHLVGKCIVVNVRDTTIVYANGSGSGTQHAVLCDYFNYTGGSGLVRPEAVRINACHIHGFTNGVTLTAAIAVNVTDTDIQATGVGVSWSTMGGPLSITNSYIEIDNSGATVGAYGLAQASVGADVNVTIRGNQFVAVGTTAGTTVGVQLGDSGTGNQDNVHVCENSFTGFTKYDIAVYKSGHVTARGNRCQSSGVTASIFSTLMSANKPSYFHENHCAGVMTHDSGDVTGHVIQVGRNVVSGTTQDYGNVGDSGWITPTFAAGDYTGSVSMTWTVASGDVIAQRYRIVGKSMTVSMILGNTTVGGTLDSRLKFKIPASKTVAVRSINPCHILDNGTRSIAYLEADPGDNTFVTVNRSDGANWAASTDNTYVRGTITFEIA